MLRITALAGLIAIQSISVSAQTVVQGFGDNIPLAHAIEQIVPENYVVSFGKGVSVNEPVSWRGGTDWKSVLDVLAKNEGLSVRYDQDNILITQNPQNRASLSRGLDLVPYGDSNFEARIRDDSYASDIMANKPGLIFGGSGQVAHTEPEKETGFGYVELNETEKVTPTNPPLPDSIFIGVDDPSIYKPAQDIWEVFAGTTLEDILMDWGDRSGWTVIWNSEYSYPIVADAQFRGEFVDVAAKLIRSMERARPPVRGEFYKGNKVLVMETILDGQS